MQGRPSPLLPPSPAARTVKPSNVSLGSPSRFRSDLPSALSRTAFHPPVLSVRVSDVLLSVSTFIFPIITRGRGNVKGFCGRSRLKICQKPVSALWSRYSFYPKPLRTLPYSAFQTGIYHTSAGTTGDKKRSFRLVLAESRAYLITRQYNTAPGRSKGRGICRSYRPQAPRDCLSGRWSRGRRRRSRRRICRS